MNVDTINGSEEDLSLDISLKNFLLKMPKLSSVDKAIVLNEWYETATGLYNHFDGSNRRPIASVALHPQEDIYQGDLLKEHVDQFSLKNIYKTFGINLIDFLNLPRHVCEMITVAATNELRRKATEADKIEKDLEDLND